ncbi:MAG TPA: hypothetical protein VKC11_04915 [Steroidobacteraceae bacterium]|nr:hypothetical protein [Steroidobacteraceae bacterium]
MRLILASARGLLSGWLIALTLPLLVDPHTISAWSAASLGSRSRMLLAAAESLGAALFAFEAQVAAGLVLLIASFVGAGIVHLHHGEVPWWLVAEAIAATLLWRFTARAGHRGGRPSGGPAPG